jgi:hypothetical protein
VENQFPTLSFPSELQDATRKELQSLVSQFYPRAPIDIPYSRQNFEARSGMTITLDESQIHQFFYIKESPNLFDISLSTLAFTLGGVMNNGIFIRIPEDRVADRTVVTAGHGADNGVFQCLRVTTFGGGQWIGVYKEALTNWTASAATYIGFQVRVRLLPIAA